MDPVVHFEMPYTDGERMAAFYRSAFGWETQKMGAEMGNYILAMTTPSDSETGRPNSPGAINGGFYDRKSTPDAPEPSVVIAVDDLQKSKKQIESAGGKLLGDQIDIPGVGLYIAFKDSEGNRVGALQPAPMGGGGPQG